MALSHSDLLAKVLAAGNPDAIWRVIESHLEEIGADFFETVAAEVRRHQDEGNVEIANAVLQLPMAVAGVRVGPDHGREWIAADTALEQARKLMKQGHSRAALREVEEARERYERIGHSKGIGDTWLMQARLHESSDDFSRAAEGYQKAVDHYQGQGLWRFESEALGRLGELRRTSGRNSEAREFFQRQLKCAATVRLAEQEAEAHLGLGICWQREGDADLARIYLREAIALSKAAAALRIEANAVANLGAIAQSEGDTETARLHLTRAGDLYRQAGLSEGIRLVEGLMAEMESSTGQASLIKKVLALDREAQAAKKRCDFHAALDLRQRALELARKAGDQYNEAVMQGNIGNLYREELGDLETALSYFEGALDTAREAARPGLQAWMLRTIGLTRRDLGQFEDAARYLQMAVELAETAGDEKLLLKALIEAGNVAKNAGRTWEAQSSYEKAMEVTERLGDDQGKVLCLGNLGNVKEIRGDVGGARELYERGLELAQRIDYTQGIGNQSNNLGSIHHRAGNYGAAISCFKRALEAADLMANPEFRVAALKNLSLVYQGNGQLAEALESLDDALASVDPGVRPDVHTAIYRARAEVAQQLGRDEAAAVDWAAACEVLEAAADRRFAERQEIVVYADLAKHYQARIHLTASRGRSEEVLLRLEEIKSKPVRAPAREASLELSGMKELLDRQGVTTAFVHYGELEDSVVAAILRSDRPRPEVETLPLTMADVKDSFQRFLPEVERHSEQPDLDETWQEIVGDAVECLMDHVRGCELIYLSPQRILWYLPLHALSVDGRPLLARFPIAYADSFARLAAVQGHRHGRRQSCLAAGVALVATDDAIFEGEAKLAARAFHTEAYVGQQVTRQLLLDEMPGKDVIHISAHGHWHVRGAKLILCNESERLAIRDVERCRLDAELVWLSGCDTGWFDTSCLIVGIRSLHTAFLNAGATTAVAPGWPIPSPVSLQIAHGFYQRLGESGTSKAEALRRAQLSILEKPHYRGHTYYWAPFSLIGDWR